jgi:hypothetical protein
MMVFIVLMNVVHTIRDGEQGSLAPCLRDPGFEHGGDEALNVQLNPSRHSQACPSVFCF